MVKKNYFVIGISLVVFFVLLVSYLYFSGFNISDIKIKEKDNYDYFYKYSYYLDKEYEIYYMHDGNIKVMSFAECPLDFPNCTEKIEEDLKMSDKAKTMIIRMFDNMSAKFVGTDIDLRHVELDRSEKLIFNALVLNNCDRITFESDITFTEQKWDGGNSSTKLIGMDYKTGNNTVFDVSNTLNSIFMDKYQMIYDSLFKGDNSITTSLELVDIGPDSVSFLYKIFDDKEIVFYSGYTVDYYGNILQIPNQYKDSIIKESSDKYYNSLSDDERGQLIEGWYGLFEALILKEGTYYKKDNKIFFIVSDILLAQHNNKFSTIEVADPGWLS